MYVEKKINVGKMARYGDGDDGGDGHCDDDDDGHGHGHGHGIWYMARSHYLAHNRLQVL